MVYEEKPTASQLKLLRVVLGALVLGSAGFGLRLIVGALLLGAHGMDWGQEGSRAFFMSLSGLTLLVFATGFVMMIREVTAAIKKRTAST